MILTEKQPARVRPDHFPGLLCWWDFQEPAGSPRVSKGLHHYALQERLGPVERADEGVLGLPHSLKIAHGQWLWIPRSLCPGLNLHGRQPLTLIAWVRRHSPRPWQFIAGMWDERDRRQYGLFTSGTKQYDCTTDSRHPAHHQPHGYLSANGGKSDGKEACFSYATGATELEIGVWYCLAVTWDGAMLRVYCNGRLDTNAARNPIPFQAPLFNGDNVPRNGPPWGHLPGADFTVGQHGHVDWANYPEATGPAYEGFEGLLGSLCIYNRALPDHEISLL